MSAVLIRVAARTRQVAVADCDVEASNLPLALRAHVVSSTPCAGRSQTVVDHDLCEGCGDCLDRCRFGALSLSVAGLATIDPWLCESCGACAQACDVDAIDFEPQQAGEILVGDGTVGPIVSGRLRPGEDLSGKLVTSVRERVGELAVECGAELVLVDGPPGVGCPAISSITGADGVLAVTEPTLSGEHDLRRLVTLAQQMRVPVKVVLNKADLSAAGAGRIRATCRDLGLDLVGEVAFDAGLPPALEAVAQGTSLPPSLDGLTSVRSMHAVWSRLEPWIDGWGRS
jgi:MinD superfamily P-loop ATPase